MTEYQITSWRDIPSMVAARDGESITKIQLAARFQEAIDEAAMRLGETSSDAYLEGWSRSGWTPGDGDHADVAARIAASLEHEWTPQRLTDYLDALTP
ncbi:MAG: virulence factor [Actinomycetes bacterium]